MDDKDIHEIMEDLRRGRQAARTTLMREAKDKKEAYAELYNEHPWDFEPGTW